MYSKKEPISKNIIEKQVEKIKSPFEYFIQKQSNAGFLLFFSSIISILIMNSSWSFMIHSFLTTSAGFYFDEWEVSMDMKEWVNSGLLSIFFFHIGLELKKELIAGEMKKAKYIVLVVFSAIGGMIVPALIYFLLNQNGVDKSGWAIPMGTDTAFSIALLSILSRKIHPSISIFLVTLAIFDDIGSIAIIAIFYTQKIFFLSLGCALVILLIILFFNFIGFRRPYIYIFFGVIFWYCIHLSGIHGSVSGILFALLIPARTKIKHSTFKSKLKKMLTFLEKKEYLEKTDVLHNPENHRMIMELKTAADKATTPLQRWKGKFQVPVGILILPIFAFCNIGFPIDLEKIESYFQSNIFWGIFLGLVVGKPLGILMGYYFAVRFKLGQLSENLSFKDLVGIGFFSGIGFTISILIANLGFKNYESIIDLSKFAIFFASITSGIIGFSWFLSLH